MLRVLGSVAVVALLSGVAAGQSSDIFSGSTAGSGGGRYQGHTYTGGNTDALLWDNGPVTDVVGPPALSVITAPGTLFGAGAQGGGTNNSVADDFTVGAGGWNVNQLTFFMYQTGAASAFTFTGVNYQIVSNNADPISWTAAVPGNGGLVGYRVTATTLGDTNRAIFALTVPVALSLTPGNYFLRWQATGSLASGPWQPPVVPSVAGGNSTQSLTGGVYNPLIDTGSSVQLELPFRIDGTVAPAPGSLALLGLAGLAAARRRRA